MAAPLIPMRPKGGKYDLREEEKDGLTWYVLSGCTREDAFLKFIRPDFIGSKASTAIKAAVQQFFAVKDVKDYIENYKATLQNINAEKEKPAATPQSIEEKMARAKIKATEFAVALAEDLDNAKDPEVVLKIMDKVHIFDLDNEGEEVPRRYIPEDCDSCRYRAFCEKEGEDLCPHCKYRQFAENQGIHYESQQQMDFGI